MQLTKDRGSLSFYGVLKEGLSSERCVLHAAFGSNDQREGMDAFLSTRAPVFKHGKR